MCGIHCRGKKFMHVAGVLNRPEDNVIGFIIGKLCVARKMFMLLVICLSFPLNQ